MAKRKKPSNDQPELPLGAAPVASEDKGQKPEDNKSPSSHTPQVTGHTASDAPPPPKRKKGEKVQDEQAPLAQSYRNWFLDYASYVILDRAVPHIDDGLKQIGRASCRERV